ncbi:hypothetical protein QZH41_015383 [Actinostola sp. cb2023]|nr:hypothetical protein QZH41_015383 [Actinostola sp. cb2023]
MAEIEELWSEKKEDDLVVFWAEKPCISWSSWANSLIKLAYTRYSNGRYCVGVPWKKDKPTLPNNYDMALNRLQNTEKRLLRDRDVGESYQKFVSQRNAIDNESQYPLAVATVLKSTYMDDSMDSAKDVTTAIELRNQLGQLWGTDGMHVTKWLSNAPDVLRDIPSADCATAVDLDSELRTHQSLRAFSQASVDFAGPFLTKQGRGKTRQKRHLCLFTCLSTRAVHLEMANALDTDAFLNAFYRMVSRRGLPDVMVSDNGTNFASGDRELKELVEAIDRDKMQESTANKGVQWHFNPPAAPHFNGVHEIMIKAAKRAIKAILGDADVTDEELMSAIVGVEGLINSRPLTYQSANASDEVPLTPNHFLHGQMGGQFAPETVDSINYSPGVVSKSLFATFGNAGFGSGCRNWVTVGNGQKPDKISRLEIYFCEVRKGSCKLGSNKETQKKVAEEVKASGIAIDEPSELELGVEEICEKAETAERDHQMMTEEKKSNLEKEKKQAEDMRAKALEKVGETKKRLFSDDSSGEPEKKEKKARRSGTETIAYLKDKSEK